MSLGSSQYRGQPFDIPSTLVNLGEVYLKKTTTLALLIRVSTF